MLDGLAQHQAHPIDACERDDDFFDALAACHGWFGWLIVARGDTQQIRKAIAYGNNFFKLFLFLLILQYFQSAFC
jgi:hypothetical protein